MQDPTRQALLEHVQTYFGPVGPNLDEAEVEEAIYWFSADYHGGQASNLYSILSTSPYRPGLLGQRPEDPAIAKEIYDSLVLEFT